MNVLIVEDETHTAILLKEMIEANSNYSVVITLATIIDTVDYLRKNEEKIDLCFFDIQLADGKCFEIFKHIDVSIPVVFCTAYDEFTLKAIKNNGIDYILKPFKEEEIHEALQRFEKLSSGFKAKYSALNAQKPPEHNYQKNFLIHYRGRTIVKERDEVSMFSIEHDVVYLYDLEGDKYSVYKKMDYLESVCDPKLFFRVNRQILLHRKAFQSYEPSLNRKLVLTLDFKTEKEIIVSRLKVGSFKKWLIQ